LHPSHHPQFIDVLHRDHATVETDGVRTAKTMGLRNLPPSKTRQVNKGWGLAANIAADLTAWARLLGFHDQEGLRDAKPDTLRYHIWHIPAPPRPPRPETEPEDQPGLALERRLHHVLNGRRWRHRPPSRSRRPAGAEHPVRRGVVRLSR
jgi:hypothetical protein